MRLFSGKWSKRYDSVIDSCALCWASLPNTVRSVRYLRQVDACWPLNNHFQTPFFTPLPVHTIDRPPCVDNVYQPIHPVRHVWRCSWYNEAREKDNLDKVAMWQIVGIMKDCLVYQPKDGTFQSKTSQTVDDWDSSQELSCETWIRLIDSILCGQRRHHTILHDPSHQPKSIMTSIITYHSSCLKRV